MSRYFSPKNTLIVENKILKNEVDRLITKLALSSGLQKENDELRMMLGRKVGNERKLAFVLRAPPFSPYDTLVLDIGASSGVAVGDSVVSPADIAIGKITDVFQGYSKAKLYSAPGEVTPVLVGVGRVPAEANGLGGGGLSAIMPREVAVSVGDDVFLSYGEPVYYGKVDSIITRDTDFLQAVSFESSVNLYELRFVAIVQQFRSDDE